jgi:hypothetical protein
VNVDSLLRKIEKNGQMNQDDLRIFISSCIPESCKDCFWLDDKEKMVSCPSPREAPCRMYLHRILNYLESKGLI